MAFVGQFQQSYFDTVVAWTPDVELAVEAVVVVDDLSRRWAAVMLDPYVQCWLCTAEAAHVVASAVDVEDRNWSHIGIGRCSAHRITADRTEGCNEVGNLVHGVVSEHTAHGEAPEIDAVAVNLVLRCHLVDDGLDEIDVTIAGGVPCLVDSVREDNDELGGVAHCFHAHIVVLEFAVLHPVGVLIVAVTEDEEWTVFTEVLRCIDVVRAAGAVNCDVVCLHGLHDSHEKDE